MSTANEIMRLRQAKADIKAAIEAKGLSVPDSAKLDEYDDYIAAIPSGGEDPYPYVEFVDYEGTVLHKLSLDEAHALEDYPAAPEHPGLTFEGWTIQLAHIKNTAVSLTVGPNYITSDGKTRIYIDIPAGAENNAVLRTVAMRFNATAAGGVTIDWGDGSAPETPGRANNNSTIYPAHTYAVPGSYVIQLAVTAGTIAIINTNTPLFFYTHNQRQVRKIEFGIGWYNTGGICQGLTALESVTIPQYMYSLPLDWYQAFLNCASLRYFPFLHSMTTVATAAFNGCSSLRGILFFTVLETISGNNAFRGTAIEEIAALGRVTSLGGAQNQGTFSNCSSLRKAILPASLTEVSGGAFHGCTSLESVTIPASVKVIGASAFDGCTALDLTLPTSITTINTSAFRNVKRIADINLPNLTTLTGNQIFYGAGVMKVTSLGRITSLGGVQNQGTFASCLLLSEVTLPATLTTIEASAFDGCASLPEITIPASVTSIGVQAFRGCTFLKRVALSSSTPPTVGANPFQNDLCLAIIVPADAYDTYKAASVWSDYNYALRKAGVDYGYTNDTPDTIIDNQGNVVAMPGYSLTDYIPVTAGNRILLSRHSDWTAVQYYDGNKEYMSRAAANSGPVSLAVPANAAYIRFSYLSHTREGISVYDTTANVLVYPYET